MNFSTAEMNVNDYAIETIYDTLTPIRINNNNNKNEYYKKRVNKNSGLTTRIRNYFLNK